MNTSSTLRSFKTVVTLSLCVMALDYSGNARAATYDVDPSWTIPQINNLLDSDSGTLAKAPYENVVLTDGDIVSIALGQYTMPTNNWLKMRVGGSGVDPVNDVITIQGAGWGAGGTEFIGSQASGEPIWQIFSDNVVFNDFSTRNSNAGIVISSADYSNVNFNFIHTQGHDNHFAYNRQNAAGVIDTPSIKLNNIYMQDGKTGVHINPSGVPLGDNTEFPEIKNCTLDNLAEVGINADLYAPAGTIIARGESFWTDNLIMNSNAPFIEQFYPPQNRSLVGAERILPDSLMESENVSPSMASQGLGLDLDVDGVPDFNEEEMNPGLMLNQFGEPMRGSPLICAPTVVPDGRTLCAKGYKGAIPPAAVAPIPTMSTWGLVNTALLMGVTGTLIYGRNKRTLGTSR